MIDHSNCEKFPQARPPSEPDPLKIWLAIVPPSGGWRPRLRRLAERRPALRHDLEALSAQDAFEILCRHPNAQIRDSEEMAEWCLRWRRIESIRETAA